MSQYAIILAAGMGVRMNAQIPKQFLLLKNIPILMHTIRAFEQYAITLVLADNQHRYWHQLCHKYDFNISHKLVKGGATRFQSVANGLKVIPDQGLVAIHDGVRPLIDTNIIRKSFDLAKKHGNAVTAIPLKDSIRKMVGFSNQAIDRSKYQLIQTPQTFDISLIKKAYATKELPLFTDDANVLENDGHAIHLFEGSSVNIKITQPKDLVIAEALLNS